MPKETKKSGNGSLPPAVFSPARSGSASPYEAVYGSGAPDLKTDFPAPDSLLDTIVYLPLSAYYEGNVIRGKENLSHTLKNRARAKFVTGLVAAPLASLVSPLQSQYVRSQSCAGALTETPGKLTSMYCNCRWCLVCSRIRTAKMISAYLPQIERMKDKWFVTLSRPNVKKADLRTEVQHYVKTSQLINRYLREKLELEFSFIRKTESTYNDQADTYHPHFHFIVDSEVAARAMLADWLRRNKTAKLDKGNHIQKADNNSAAELFKYFTKVVSKSANSKAADYKIHLSALDTMFVAMRGVRTFQAGGLIKTVSEDVEPEQALESGRFSADFWKWTGNDWVSRDTAVLLSGYTPSDGIRDIPNHLVYPAGVAPVIAPVAPLQPFYVDRETGEILPHELAHHVLTAETFARVVVAGVDGRAGVVAPGEVNHQFVKVRPLENEKPAPGEGGGLSPLPASWEIMPVELGPWPPRLCAAPLGYCVVESPSGRLLVALAVSALSVGKITSVPARASKIHHLAADKMLKGMPIPAP